MGGAGVLGRRIPAGAPADAHGAGHAGPHGRTAAGPRLLWCLGRPRPQAAGTWRPAARVSLLSHHCMPAALSIAHCGTWSDEERCVYPAQACSVWPEWGHARAADGQGPEWLPQQGTRQGTPKCTDGRPGRRKGSELSGASALLTPHLCCKVLERCACRHASVAQGHLIACENTWKQGP